MKTTVLTTGIAAALGLLTVQGAANAAPMDPKAEMDTAFSYDYVRAGWVFADEVDIDLDDDLGGDDLDADINGLNGGFKATVAPNIFVLGNVTALDVEIDENDGGFDDDADFGVDIYELGVGAFMPVVGGATPVDIYGALGYSRLDLVGQPGNGWFVKSGVRIMAMPGLEIAGWVGYNDWGNLKGVFDAADDPDADAEGVGYGINAAFEVAPNVDVTGGWERWNIDLDIDSGSDTAKNDLDMDMFHVGARLRY